MKVWTGCEMANRRAQGGIQILGMVRREWLRLASQAYGRGAGCWVIAGTWPPPGVSLAPRSLSVCSCSPGSLPLWSSVRLRLPLESSWLLKAASSTSLLLCVSLRLSLQATSGACSASSWLRFSPRVGRAGGLASPSPFVGAVLAAGSSGVVLVGGSATPGLMLGAIYAAGMFVLARLFWGRLGRVLGISRPIAGCLPRGRGLVVSCAVSFSSVGLWL